jgi:cell division protein FtsB
MKWLAAALLAALLLLQYRLWLSDDGVREVVRIEGAVATQQAENAQLTERNRQLAAEVRDLKQGYAALEELARADLGMISGNETYYQIVPPPADAASTAVPASTAIAAAAAPRPDVAQAGAPAR